MDSSETEGVSGHAEDGRNAHAEERARAAEERARLLEVRLAVERWARQAGVVDEDAAFRLLDLERLEFDDGGTPTNVEQVLGQMLEERPWLRGTHEREPQSDTAGDSDPASPANPPREDSRLLTIEAIRRMSPEEINANWTAIEAALRGQGTE